MMSAIPQASAAPFDAVASNLSLWRRPDRPALWPLLRHYVQHGPADLLFHSIAPAKVPALGRLLPPVPPALRAGRYALAADLALLVRHFAARIDTPAIRIKLEVEHADRCRFFHADRVELRLLCTYLGPGTEWVPDGFADRAVLGRGDNAAVVPDHRHVESLSPFWVGLLKGDLHPDCPGRGCIHRSPPIGHRRGTSRILLTLDAIGSTA